MLVEIKQPQDAIAPFNQPDNLTRITRSATSGIRVRSRSLFECRITLYIMPEAIAIALLFQQIASTEKMP